MNLITGAFPALNINQTDLEICCIVCSRIGEVVKSTARCRKKNGGKIRGREYSGRAVTKRRQRNSGMINSRNKVESRKYTAQQSGDRYTHAAPWIPLSRLSCRRAETTARTGARANRPANFEFINFACAILREIAARVLRPPVDYTNLLSCSCCNTPCSPRRGIRFCIPPHKVSRFVTRMTI